MTGEANRLCPVCPVELSTQDIRTPDLQAIFKPHGVNLEKVVVLGMLAAALLHRCGPEHGDNEAALLGPNLEKLADEFDNEAEGPGRLDDRVRAIITAAFDSAIDEIRAAIGINIGPDICGAHVVAARATLRGVRGRTEWTFGVKAVCRQRDEMLNLAVACVNQGLDSDDERARFDAAFEATMASMKK